MRLRFMPALALASALLLGGFGRSVAETNWEFSGKGELLGDDYYDGAAARLPTSSDSRNFGHLNLACPENSWFVSKMHVSSNHHQQYDYMLSIEITGGDYIDRWDDFRKIKQDDDVKGSSTIYRMLLRNERGERFVFNSDSLTFISHARLRPIHIGLGKNNSYVVNIDDSSQPKPVLSQWRLNQVGDAAHEFIASSNELYVSMLPELQPPSQFYRLLIFQSLYSGDMDMELIRSFAEEDVVHFRLPSLDAGIRHLKSVCVSEME